MERFSIMAITGLCGSLFVNLFGGWNEAMTTLVLFMTLDYITGIICAGVFGKSTKTEDGGLESKAGYKGIARKCGIIFLVLVACRLDIVLETNYIQDCVIIAFICNETISITENIGLMGVPLPSVVSNAITLLNKKGDNKNEF